MDLFDFVYIGVMLSLFVGVWGLYRWMFNKAEEPKALWDYGGGAPGTYKVITVTKRPYTKRSKYWTDKRKKAGSKTKRKPK